MKRIIRLVILVVFLIICCCIIENYNFNGFKLANFYPNISKARRDKNEKYNGEWSYKIESPDYNDFMIYKTVKVNKHTAYKVSCMVKTKDVIAENTDSGIGFNICLKDKLEKSASISGTTEWTNLDFYFNSNDSETIDIAFRLGDNSGNCKGIVWFANIQIEEGRKSSTTNWNFAVFMINNVKVDKENLHINQRLSINQASTIENSFELFTQTLSDFTNRNIKSTYDFIYIDEPLSNISTDEQFGYYISNTDAFPLINEYILKKDYDHIFVVANLGDEIINQELDWIGLGGMVYNSIGYSNIRISDSIMNIYKTSNTNFFQEEVFLHEFLHTLERNSIEKGYQTTALHDYEKFGYTNQARVGLRKWYLVYIQNQIENGIREDVYFTQPMSKSNFISRKGINEKLYDEQNIIQKILEKIGRII